jgi:hypothetical protein
VTKKPSIDAAALIARGLVGHCLIAVERREYDWAFSFEDNLGISVSCPWRILAEGSIAYGDTDDGQKFGLATPIDGAVWSTQLLHRKLIEAVAIRYGPGDLVITFSERMDLEIPNFSCGYEGWHYVESTGLNIVAKGGGELALWQG